MRLTMALCFTLALAGCGRRTAAMTAHLAVAPAEVAISVRSSAIGADGRIAARNSAYGANLTPPLTWTRVAGAKSYVIILEDPDAPGSAPFDHWLMWNIPAAITWIPEGAKPPAGASLGRNGLGQVGYFGPHPPSGVHRYHFKVYALDTMLALRQGAGRDALENAIRGRIVGAGEVVGLASAP